MINKLFASAVVAARLDGSSFVCDLMDLFDHSGDEQGTWMCNCRCETGWFQLRLRFGYSLENPGKAQLCALAVVAAKLDGFSSMRDLIDFFVNSGDEQVIYISRCTREAGRFQLRARWHGRVGELW